MFPLLPNWAVCFKSLPPKFDRWVNDSTLILRFSNKGFSKRCNVLIWSKQIFSAAFFLTTQSFFNNLAASLYSGDATNLLL